MLSCWLAIAILACVLRLSSAGLQEQLDRFVTSKVKEEIKMPSFLIYVICHNEHSLAIAGKTVQNISWAKPVLIRSTKYFESIVYMDMFPFHYNEWKDLDYVGSISYKIAAATQFGFEQLSTLIAVGHAAGYDVIPFVRSNHNLIKTAVVSHPQTFAPAWYALLEALEFSDTVASNHSANLKAFYRNAFVCRPAEMLLLSTSMSTAIMKVNMNSALSHLFEQDSHYKGEKSVSLRIFGKTYYELHPFVFERLPVFFFNMMQARVCLDTVVCPVNY
jgi:hypothetical protein